MLKHSSDQTRQLAACPNTGKQIRQSTKTRNLPKAEEKREVWEAQLFDRLR